MNIIKTILGAAVLALHGAGVNAGDNRASDPLRFR